MLLLTCNSPHKPLVGLGKHVNKLRHTQSVRIYTESRLKNTPYKRYYCYCYYKQRVTKKRATAYCNFQCTYLIKFRYVVLSISVGW